MRTLLLPLAAAFLVPALSPAQVAMPRSSVLGEAATVEVTVSAAVPPGKLVIPVPPAEDAAEPERIVHYFCRAWKDWDFKAMYGAMTDPPCWR